MYKIYPNLVWTTKYWEYQKHLTDEFLPEIKRIINIRNFKQFFKSYEQRNMERKLFLSRRAKNIQHKKEKATRGIINIPIVTISTHV